MKNLITQRVGQETRCRGDEPARHDLIFTLTLTGKIKHECAFGRSDHEGLRFELSCNCTKLGQKEQNRKGNIFKARYFELRFFYDVDWTRNRAKELCTRKE